MNDRDREIKTGLLKQLVKVERERDQLKFRLEQAVLKIKKMRTCLLSLKTTKHEDSPCDEFNSHMSWLCDVCKQIDEALK